MALEPTKCIPKELKRGRGTTLALLPIPKGVMLFRLQFKRRFVLLLSILLTACPAWAGAPRVVIAISQKDFLHKEYRRHLQDYERQTDGTWKAVRGSKVSVRESGKGLPSIPILPKEVGAMIDELVDPTKSWKLQFVRGDWAPDSKMQIDLEKDTFTVDFGVELAVTDSGVQSVTARMKEIGYDSKGELTHYSLLGGRYNIDGQWKWEHKESEESKIRRTTKSIRPDILHLLEKTKSLSAEYDRTEQLIVFTRFGLGSEELLRKLMYLDQEEFDALTGEKFNSWMRSQLEAAKYNSENRLLVVEGDAIKPATLAFKNEEPHILVEGKSKAILPPSLFRDYQFYLGSTGPKEVTWTQQTFNPDALGKLRHLLLDFQGSNISPYWIAHTPPELPNSMAGPMYYDVDVIKPGQFQPWGKEIRGENRWDYRYPTPSDCGSILSHLSDRRSKMNK